jgi:hypothetical protein
MSISPLNHPVNVLVCKTAGTIFSGNTGGGGSGGTALNFVNLGSVGARVLAGVVANNVQYRRIVQGNNVTVTEEASDILIDVNDLAFDSTLAVKRAIPGLQGVVLGKSTILQTLQALLYPTIGPGVSLSINTNLFEFGDTTPIMANWGVTRTDEAITLIQVGGVTETPTGNTQSGTQSVVNPGTGSVTVLLTAATASTNSNTSQTASAQRKIRIGASGKDGIIATITDGDLNALTGYFSPGRPLSPKTVVIGVSQYLVIEIPTIYSGTPIFKINGFVNNAFNKVRSNQSFTNNFGFAEPVDVYVSQAFSTGTITVEIV